MSACQSALDATEAAADVFRLLAMNAIDYLQTKSLFVHNTRQTAWGMTLIFDKNGIDRHLSVWRRVQVFDDVHCRIFANSK